MTLRTRSNYNDLARENTYDLMAERQLKMEYHPALEIVCAVLVPCHDWQQPCSSGEVSYSIDQHENLGISRLPHVGNEEIRYKRRLSR